MEIKKIEKCDYVMMPRMQHRGLVPKHVERELYNGLLEMANAYPQEYVDGCPFIRDVVRRALKSEIIENYLNEK